MVQFPIEATLTCKKVLDGWRIQCAICGQPIKIFGISRYRTNNQYVLDLKCCGYEERIYLPNRENNLLQDFSKVRVVFRDEYFALLEFI